jgi:predicted nucleic acid-binding Zn ribbon protein
MRLKRLWRGILPTNVDSYDACGWVAESGKLSDAPIELRAIFKFPYYLRKEEKGRTRPSSTSNSRQEAIAVMTPFHSISSIVESFKRQELWDEKRAFDRLVRAWPDAVGANVSRQTRLVEIRQDVLYVATSHSVWAQQLGFQRKDILAKLNAKLPRPLKDIRFSPGQWHRRPLTNSLRMTDEFLDHPCRWTGIETEEEWRDRASPPSPPQTAREAFDLWAKKIQSRTRSLPLCPKCQCPTPPKELAYWSVCALCSPSLSSANSDSANSNRSNSPAPE